MMEIHDRLGKKKKKKKKVLLLLKFHVIECIKRKKRKNKHLDSESPLHTHRFSIQHSNKLE
jgi:hypothetical protein